MSTFLDWTDMNFDDSVKREIHPLLKARWSPRAFDGSTIEQNDLNILLEGAGLAPSAFNYQPWRFLYAHRDGEDWNRFLRYLNDFNRGWAGNASVIIYIVSDKSFALAEATSDSYSYSFDAGAAWAHLALQATAMGYHAHAMTGIDFDGVRIELTVPDHFRIEAAVALGRRAEPQILPAEMQASEVRSARKPIPEFAAAGNFIF